MKPSIIYLKKINKSLFGIVIFLVIWQGVSSFYSSLVLPNPISTFKALKDIIYIGNLISETLTTLTRFAIALTLAIVIGSFAGIMMGINKGIRGIFESIIYTIQGIPPILYMTLAMLWFGLNGLATIFIVVIGSAPIMAISLKEGFENIDTNLIEMAHAFCFTKKQMLIDIILPAVKPYFISGVMTIIALGFKILVMGEVLCASKGIGARITEARVNLETEYVFAWGIIIIILCYIFQKGGNYLLKQSPKRKNYDNT